MSANYVRHVGIALYSLISSYKNSDNFRQPKTLRTYDSTKFPGELSSP
ncbi:hypothetical protein COMA2_10304 [Candidatus Nitrospira nitrificans]|uniref:Uncharacterized protein n=1 Tax=Candidatus Nitrospira nitrificans TaxID=1742973 RepID=A0A0S4L4Y6_9BACT|nr:hypothetical protein COMA2_10304 [Candidatus Nitrospira nitrificans]